MTAARHSRLPAGWDTEMSDEYEWVPLRLPPEVTWSARRPDCPSRPNTAAGELTRVRLYNDGSRRVLLRRKKSRLDGAGYEGRRPDQPQL